MELPAWTTSAETLPVSNISKARLMMITLTRLLVMNSVTSYIVVLRLFPGHNTILNAIIFNEIFSDYSLGLPV